MEMLYAANLDLHADTEHRRQRFAAGLRAATARNFRPHLLYGTRESEIGVGIQAMMLPPLQNSFAVTHSPSKGEISKSSDWPKITELMAALTIRSVVAGYEGKRNASGEMHGVGRLTEKNGGIL